MITREDIATCEAAVDALNAFASLPTPEAAVSKYLDENPELVKPWTQMVGTWEEFKKFRRAQRREMKRLGWRNPLPKYQWSAEARAFIRSLKKPTTNPTTQMTKIDVITERLIEQADGELRKKCEKAGEDLMDLIRDGCYHEITFKVGESTVALSHLKVMQALRECAFNAGRDLSRTRKLDQFLAKIEQVSEQVEQIQQSIPQ